MSIEHVAIWTQQLERLRAFYETYFEARAGAKYANPGKGFESYFLTFPSGGARLELMRAPGLLERPGEPGAPVVGCAHLAVSAGSKEEVDALTARLQTDGYPVVSGPRTTGDGYYESVILDPDGNRIEIAL